MNGVWGVGMTPETARLESQRLVRYKFIDMVAASMGFFTVETSAKFMREFRKSVWEPPSPPSPRPPFLQGSAGCGETLTC